MADRQRCAVTKREIETWISVQLWCKQHKEQSCACNRNVRAGYCWWVPGKYSLQKTECSIFADLWKDEDKHIYRANPVLIYEETDDSSTDSEVQSSGPQENIISFDPLNSQKQERDVQVPFPRQLSSTLQEDRPTEIRQYKHISGREYSESRAAGVKEASVIKKFPFSLTWYHQSFDHREKSNGETVTSSYKTMVVTDKVSQSESRQMTAEEIL